MSPGISIIRHRASVIEIVEALRLVAGASLEGEYRDTMERHPASVQKDPATSWQSAVQKPMLKSAGEIGWVRVALVVPMAGICSMRAPDASGTDF